VTAGQEATCVTTTADVYKTAAATMKTAAAAMTAALERQRDVEDTVRARMLPTVAAPIEDEILRERPEFQWLTGAEPPREPTADEQAAYARRQTDGTYLDLGLVDAPDAAEALPAGVPECAPSPAEAAGMADGPADAARSETAAREDDSQHADEPHSETPAGPVVPPAPAGQTSPSAPAIGGAGAEGDAS
jgi:hypothetical protein